jgi:TolB-like protein/DNA-binding winged helix-turn-helix (wHTH) protein
MGRQVRFGDWTFDLDENVLAGPRSSIQLEPQVAKLLEYLLNHQDRLLTRDELVRELWNGRVVSNDAVHRCIGVLRQCLSPDAKQAYIRTVPRRGYIARFPAPAGSAPEPRRERSRAVRTAIGGAALLVVLVAAAVGLRLGLGPDLAPGLRDRLAGGDTTESPAGAPVASIAVLPFTDLSPNRDQGYFADGISEDILNMLSQVDDLRVTARTSSFSLKERDADIATIARELDVTHVLDGSVRRSGNRVRIVAQLVDAATSTQLWSARYDRELGDILNVQAEIAGAVATALEAELGIGFRERTHQRLDPVAFDAYLHGLQQIRTWTAPSLVDAERSFRAAVDREPRFARAWYGLGLALLLQVIHEVKPARENVPRMREVIARGLELEPDGAGFLALEGQVARYDGDAALAARFLEEALRRDPSDVWIRNLYCFLRMDMGEPRAALSAQRRTLEIDPLNPTVYVAVGFSHVDLGQLEEALTAAQRFRQLNSPGNATAIGMNGVIRIVLEGDYAGAIREALAGIDAVPRDEKVWSAIYLAVHYYTLEDFENGDAWRREAFSLATPAAERSLSSLDAYATLARGDPRPFRRLRADRLLEGEVRTRLQDFDLYLLADELIERGQAERAVEVMLEIAPEWAAWKERADLPAQAFYPASPLVKSGFSSFPAMHFVPFIRALRATGDRAGAENMLRHFETIVASRREAGLLVGERYVAEARVLRGDRRGALDALEQAERDRTIHHWWQLTLLHSGVFAELRGDPRFTALIGRIRADLERQRAELAKEATPAA